MKKIMWLLLFILIVLSSNSLALLNTSIVGNPVTDRADSFGIGSYAQLIIFNTTTFNSTRDVNIIEYFAAIGGETDGAKVELRCMYNVSGTWYVRARNKQNWTANVTEGKHTALVNLTGCHINDSLAILQVVQTRIYFEATPSTGEQTLYKGNMLNNCDVSCTDFSSSTKILSIMAYTTTLTNVSITYPTDNQIIDINDIANKDYSLYVNVSTQEEGSNCTINDTAFSLDFNTSTKHNFINNSYLSDKQYYLKVDCNITDSIYNGTDTVNFVINTSYNIDNCTTYTNLTLNFTVRDISTDVLLTNFDVEGYITYFPLGHSQGSKTYYFGEDNNRDYEFCINPDNVELDSNLQIIFSKTGYETFTLNSFNFNLNKTVRNYNISLSNSTGLTEITVTLVDEYENEITGYVIEAYKYIVGSNSYVLVGGETTDSEGQVKFSLDTNYEHQFKVYDTDGVLVHTEAKQTIIQTSYTITLTLETPVTFDIDYLYEDITLTTDRTNKYFNLSWNNIADTTDRIRLYVYKTNESGSTQLSNQTSTDDDGKLSYVITESTTNISATYIANIYVLIDDKEYFFDTATLDYMKEWDVFGAESLFLTFILVGTLAMIGVFISAQAALLLTGFAMVVSWFLGFYQIASSALIGLIVVVIIVLIKVNRT